MARATATRVLATTFLLAQVMSAASAQEKKPVPGGKVEAAALAKKLLDENPPARTIVTTDIEIDDQASLHRYLLYTSELDTVGLVVSSSRFHWAGGTTADGKTIKTRDWAGNDWIDRLVAGGYAQVHANLVRHDPRYPTPKHLLSLIKLGNIVNVGEMTLKTAGSELIKNILLDDKPGPIWLQIWGGTNTVARALKSIEEEYKDTPKWKEIEAKVSERAVLYIILDQDATYKEYVAPNWPKIRVIYNQGQFGSVAYGALKRTPEPLRKYLQPEWTLKNIVRGPLLKTYPHKGGNFISEGDSPAYFHLIPTGLRSMEDAGHGGWGGRFDRRTPYIWADTLGFTKGAGKGGGALGKGKGGQPTDAMTLFQNPQVQAELKLTDAQLAKLPAASLAALAGVLSDQQLQRLRQIYLQQKGSAAVLETDVKTELKITPDQVDKVQAALKEQTRKQNELLAGGGFDPAKTQEIQKAATAAIADVLTGEQKTGLARMLGQPFQLGGGGFGGGFGAQAGGTADYNPHSKTKDSSWPQVRWLEALQLDFASRVVWTETDSYDKANHPPVAYIAPAGRDLQVKAGQTVQLRGEAADPDGDTLTFNWWQYKEAGTYAGDVAITAANTLTPQFVVPADAQVGKTIHIIFEVKDAGTPPLTRYQRVIATVK
jgi:hypothetical protein